LELLEDELVCLEEVGGGGVEALHWAGGRVRVSSPRSP
jgi:hypothetical protein